MQRFIFTFFICFFFTAGFSQNKQKSAFVYIDKYKDLAVQEMLITGIPASITLAQALHESANGTSQLAVKANNHFGVKCSSKWTGKKYYRNGNKKNSCYRKYSSVEDAYKDRSRFMTSNKKYASLFNYSNTNYKKWAYGLQKSGYASSKKYASHLIKTIELYKLYQFDLYDSTYFQKDSLGNLNFSLRNDSFKVDSTKIKQIQQATVPVSNPEIKYHVVKKGESLSTIAHKYKISVTKLKKLNGLHSDLIKPGKKLRVS